MSERPYTSSEEFVHWVTHAIGVVAALIAIPWLAFVAHDGGDSWRLASGVIFGASALLLFAASVAYHASVDPVVKTRLRKLDHSAIYVLIAGSYTPFAIGELGGGWGWMLFALVWGLALAGILAKTVFNFQSPVASTLLYLAMGWIGVVVARPLVAALSTHEKAWILAGGLMYTFGVPFYLWKDRPHMHAVWHLFVLAGVVCHFIAILSVMTPGR
jgi:hemolysin III